MKVKLRQSEVILLILDFLRRSGFVKAMRALEQDSGLCSDDEQLAHQLRAVSILGSSGEKNNGEQSVGSSFLNSKNVSGGNVSSYATYSAALSDLSFLRSLILDGEFTSAEDFLIPLTNVDPTTLTMQSEFTPAQESVASMLFHLRRQRFLELVEVQNNHSNLNNSSFADTTILDSTRSRIGSKRGGMSIDADEDPNLQAAVSGSSFMGRGQQAKKNMSPSNKNSSPDSMAVQALVTALKSVEHLCSRETFNSLCYCLTLTKVTDHEAFQSWDVYRGRLKTFDAVKELLLQDFHCIFADLPTTDAEHPEQGAAGFSNHISSNAAVSVPPNHLFTLLKQAALHQLTALRASSPAAFQEVLGDVYRNQEGFLEFPLLQANLERGYGTTNVKRGPLDSSTNNSSTNGYGDEILAPLNVQSPSALRAVEREVGAMPFSASNDPSKQGLPPDLVIEKNTKSLGGGRKNQKSIYPRSQQGCGLRSSIPHSLHLRSHHQEGQHTNNHNNDDYVPGLIQANFPTVVAVNTGSPNPSHNDNNRIFNSTFLSENNKINPLVQSSPSRSQRALLSSAEKHLLQHKNSTSPKMKTKNDNVDTEYKEGDDNSQQLASLPAVRWEVDLEGNERDDKPRFSLPVKAREELEERKKKEAKERRKTVSAVRNSRSSKNSENIGSSGDPYPNVVVQKNTGRQSRNDALAGVSSSQQRNKQKKEGENTVILPPSSPIASPRKQKDVDGSGLGTGLPPSSSSVTQTSSASNSVANPSTSSIPGSSMVGDEKTVTTALRSPHPPVKNNRQKSQSYVGTDTNGEGVLTSPTSETEIDAVLESFTPIAILRQQYAVRCIQFAKGRCLSTPSSSSITRLAVGTNAGTIHLLTLDMEGLKRRHIHRQEQNRLLSDGYGDSTRIAKSYNEVSSLNDGSNQIDVPLEEIRAPNSASQSLSGIHTGSVYALSWNRDNSLLASCSNDKSVKVVRTHSGYHGGVESQYNSTGSSSSTQAGNHNKFSLAENMANGHEGSYSPTQLLTPTIACVFKGVDVEEGHNATVRDVRFCDSPLSPEFLMSVGAGDGHARIWDVSRGGAFVNLLKVKDSPSETLYCGIFGAAKNNVSAAHLEHTVFTAGRSGVIRMWDLRSAKVVKRLNTATEANAVDNVAAISETHASKDSKNAIHSLSVQTGSVLASAGQKGVVKFWDIGTGQLIWQLRPHSLEQECRSVHFACDAGGGGLPHTYERGEYINTQKCLKTKSPSSRLYGKGTKLTRTIMSSIAEEKANHVMDTALIKMINKLQDAFSLLGEGGGGNSTGLSLPQIAVVGGQSAGKSSVLENIVGKSFLPRGSGIVTRRPLVMKLINDPTLKEDEAEFLHCKGKKFRTCDQIRAEIENATENDPRCANKGISAIPINMTYYSPNVLNLTLIDLPGMTRVAVGDQPKDINEQIRAMLMQYITQENTIILAVSPANQDLANSDAIQLAKQVDPAGSRTVGVLTKLDLMDRGTDAMDVLNNQVISLKLGYIPVVNRSQADIDGNKKIDEQWNAERQFFQSHPKYSTIVDRCGTRHLASTLSKTLVKHIKACLPDIMIKIVDFVEKKSAELEELAELEDDALKGELVLKALVNYASTFKARIEGHDDTAPTDDLSGGAAIGAIFESTFKSEINSIDVLEDMTAHQIRNIIRNTQGLMGGLFIPDEAFHVVIRKGIETLREPSVRCVRDVYEELMTLAISIQTPTMGRFGALEQRIQGAARGVIAAHMEQTRSLVETLINMEICLINSKHPQFSGNLNLHDLVNDAEAKSKEHPGGSGSSASIEDMAVDAKVISGAMLNGWMEKKKHHGMRGASWGKVYCVLQDRRLSYMANPRGANAKTIELDGVSVKELDGLAFEVSGGRNPKPYTFRCKSEEALSEWLTAVDTASDPDSWEEYVESKKRVSLQTANSQIKGRMHAASVMNATRPTAVPESARQKRSKSIAKLRKELSGPERAQCNIIEGLLDSYFEIMRVKVLDSVPKAITLMLVNTTINNLHTSLVKQLYKPALLDELLSETEDDKVRRKNLRHVLATMKEAMDIIKNVQSGKKIQ
eukprot:g1910.t1